MDIKPVVLSLISAFALQGCGGGSSDSNTSTPTPTTPPSSEQSILVNDDSILVNQSVELILYFPGQSLSNIQWTQIGGPDVSMVVDDAKVLSITVPSAEALTFQADFMLDGQQQTLTKTITPDTQSTSLVSRFGHVVSEQNKVSLRTFIDSSIVQNSIDWQQLSGPTVTLRDTEGELAIFFDAPNVSQDEVIEIQVSAQDSQGNELQDTVSILVEHKAEIPNNAYFDDRVADVKAYNSQSPYADVIVDCVYSNSLSSSCKLEKLPIIAQDTLTPTIDDIMDRVVVSHPWMGDRFKAFLEQYDQHDDFKNLLRATTAVVLSYDVRPAFYWAATGAIYLDPNFLWLTPEERDTMNESPDYRSSFGQTLQFEMLWRYVKDNNYANGYFPVNSRPTRSLDDIQYNLGYLLYHELAHANDFLPKSGWSSLDSDDRVLDAALKNSSQSDLLDVAYPLASQTLKNLAQVRYAGNTATALENSYFPEDIANFFEPDGAVYFYSYSSTREDYAMLFEELMMYTRYGISRDIAITNNAPSGSSGSEYIVAWGQRGRMSENQILQRMQFATERVLPEFDAVSAINALPPARLHTSGISWTDNLVLGNAKPGSLAKALLKSSANQRPVSTEAGYYHKPLPKH